MANMSYCRFENTLADLEDCYEHMGDSNLSRDEKIARKRMIEICQDIASDYGDTYEDD